MQNRPKGPWTCECGICLGFARIGGRWATAGWRRTFEQRFWGFVHRPDPDSCWEWLGSTDQKGYGQIGLGGRGKGMEKSNRTAWRLTNGPIPPGMNVLHHCDNPSCCNPSHLFLGTLADNNADMKAKLRLEHGATHHAVRFDYSVVEQARQMWSMGKSRQAIAGELGVPYTSVRGWTDSTKRSRTYGS